MTELSAIPEEVLRIIFRKLDGTTLFRMGQVCKYWNRIVYELSQDVSMWCSFCLYEIPTPALEQMTGLVDVDNLLECDSRMRDRILSVRLPWQYWREVYIAYCRSRCLRQWHCLRRTVRQSKFRGKPTCVKFHGKLFIMILYITFVYYCRTSGLSFDPALCINVLTAREVCVKLH